VIGDTTKREVPREPQPRGAVTKRGHRVNQDKAAARFIASPEHERMHDKNVWEIREHRDHARDSVPEWEELRELASQIKQHTLANLDRYLIQFEAAAQANGVQVHWAVGAAEHNRIVGDILRAKGTKTLIKSKSMLTDECGFREYMHAAGIEVVETDLGERIQQLDGERPSNIIGPAIHKTRGDVAEVFARELGSDPNNDDIHYLATTQRNATRPIILKAEAGLTGCNFAVAETGTVTVCTDEGNADYPPIHLPCTSSRWALRNSCHALPTSASLSGCSRAMRSASR
jgi:L-lactate dehydrogenase complex protein LldF